MFLLLYLTCPFIIWEAVSKKSAKESQKSLLIFASFLSARYQIQVLPARSFPLEVKLKNLCRLLTGTWLRWFNKEKLVQKEIYDFRLTICNTNFRGHKFTMVRLHSPQVDREIATLGYAQSLL